MRRLLPILWLALAVGCCDNYPRLEAGDPPPKAILATAPPARAERVVLISIDGCRPDAFDPADARAIKGLIARGASTSTAETIRPSITLPSHTSMLTGLDFEHHGVVWNNYRRGYIVHPTVFSVLTQTGKSSAMLFSKDKFHFLANPACVSWIYGPPVPDKIPPKQDFTKEDQLQDMIKKEEELARKSAAGMPKPTAGEQHTTAAHLAEAFAAEWPVQKWSLTFVHFRELDEAGHRRGWMGPAYLAGLAAVDRAISEIVAVIEKNGGFEKTAIIITADHGGSGYGHYSWFAPNKPENLRIPWICVGPGVSPGLKITRTIHTFDTAPTVLAFLGIGAPEGIDGTAVEEVLR